MGHGEPHTVGTRNHAASRLFPEHEPKHRACRFWWTLPMPGIVPRLPTMPKVRVWSRLCRLEGWSVCWSPIGKVRRVAMKDFDIDKYLADMDKAVETLGGSVHLIGLCQGGWMSAMYTALFPAKVRSLVLAGAPIDADAGNGAIKEMAHSLPMSFYEESGGSRRRLDAWTDDGGRLEKYASGEAMGEVPGSLRTHRGEELYRANRDLRTLVRESDRFARRILSPGRRAAL